MFGFGKKKSSATAESSTPADERRRSPRSESPAASILRSGAVSRDGESTGRTGTQRGSYAGPAATGETSAESGAHRWVDTEALMRIKSLDLRARLAMDGFLRGYHRSVRHGFSVEFSEYRNYVTGDDPRYLDWKVFARSDRYYVRRFEDETNLRCLFVLDVSRSMSFGSLPYTKYDYARTLVATLSYYLTMRRDAVGLVTIDDQLRDVLPARYRPGHWRHLLTLLEKPHQAPRTNLAQPLEEVTKLINRRTTVVVISDFLAPLDDLARPLAQLGARRQGVHLFWLLDPAERTLSFEKSGMFEDLETGRRVFVQPELQRAAYQRRLAEHEAQLRRAADACGMPLHSISSDQPLDLVLLEFIRAFGVFGSSTYHRTRGLG